MVSNIIDENSEYHQNGFMPAYSQYSSMPITWSNGEQSDQQMQYMKSVKR